MKKSEKIGQAISGTMCAETAVAFMMNRPAPYTEGFLFDLPKDETADPDTTHISKAMMDQLAAKMKDMGTGATS